MARQRILVATADAVLQGLLCEVLSSGRLTVKAVAGTAAALQALARERFHAVLCDWLLPEGGGRAILQGARERGLATPIILVTGPGDWEEAQEGLAAGAFDFLSKPVDQLSLLAVVNRALLRSGLLAAEFPEAAAAAPPRAFSFLIGTSRAMQEVLRQIGKVAGVQSNVCIYGESGTGKELVARAIHFASPRAQRPLVVFDCAAVPESLMESEMFGHVKGAFTSAVADREGVFQLADGGTLFIDEVAELSLPLQAKLLHVLQTREFRKVGGKQPVKVDVRLLAATNQDLRAKVTAGVFREDLFYRLEVIPLHLPPLRERRDDIPLLVDHFLERFNRNSPKQVQGISSRMLAALLRYPWPGNVRELENCIERAAVMSDGTLLDVEDLSLVLRGGTAPPGSPGASPLELPGPRGLREIRQEAERELIRKALQSVSGNRTRAAQLLGISLRTLQYKLRELELGEEPGVAPRQRRREARPHISAD